MKLHEAKQKLIDVMKEREHPMFVYGWLQSGYVWHMDPEIEMALVVEQLKGYGIELEGEK